MIIITALSLINLLQNCLQDLFAGYSLLNSKKIPQLIKIFPQYIPQPKDANFSEKITGLQNYNDFDYEANFPSIIIIHEGIEDFEEKKLELSIHSVRLLFGIYDDDYRCQGYTDIFNLMERTRQHLLIYRFLDDTFRLLMPLKSKLIEADTFPIYFGEMSLRYETGRPAMPFSKHFHYIKTEEQNTL